MKKIAIQDGRDTHVVVYVNWEKGEALSEAEYKAELEEETNIAAADGYYFGLWLNEHFTAASIWNMSEEEKEKAKSLWLEHCRAEMEEELCYERRVLI